MDIFIFSAYVLILLGLVIHEFGHAGAIKKRGIAVKEIGLGLHFKWIPSITFTMGKFFSGTTFRLTPLLAGAYVKCGEEDNEEEEFKKLSFSDRAACFGAGIIANIIFAAILCIFWLLSLVMTIPAATLTHPFIMKWLAIALAIGLLSWFLRRWIYMIIPFIGIAFIITIINHIIGMENPSSGLGGPITIGIFTHQTANNFPSVLLLGAVVSLSLGLTNSIPFRFLDGGRIMDIFLEKCGETTQKVGRIIKITGFYSLTAVVVIFDTIHLYDIFKN